MDTLEIAPRGKRILLCSEKVEVWPSHCVDGHRCIQCFFTGKYGCAPRFWHRSSGFMLGDNLPGYPIKQPCDIRERRESESEISLDTILWKEGSEILVDIFGGQPLIPIPDGGFTEEVTNAIRAKRLFKRRTPWRHIDQDCPYCGYPYLRHDANPDEREKKDRYKCPRCGRRCVEDSRRISEKVKAYVCELREQGFPYRKALRLINERFGRRMRSETYYKILKEKGVFVDKTGCFRDTDNPGFFRGKDGLSKAYRDKKARKRKWNYSEVYELKDATGWGGIKLGRALGIPPATIAKILRGRKNDIPCSSPV